LINWGRRDILKLATFRLLPILTRLSSDVKPFNSQAGYNMTANANLITLFLCGDVMTGRGIDQVLPTPSDPRIYETFTSSAIAYVKLAEAAHGPISRPVRFDYIWGDALAALQRSAPDVRIINLETSVTTRDDWIDKGINYRMHPDNMPCISAAQIDCCVLANNHVLDWGYAGLSETLETLKKASIKCAGAGRDIEQAEAPAIMPVADKGRVLVFAFGLESSGIPRDWAATEDKPGVNLLTDLSNQSVDRIAARVQGVKRPGDIVVASIHWGGNWGYEIPEAQTRLAHDLIDRAGVDVVHGHSSHHAKGIEVYHDKPILYGCGDFLNDYEGISGYESFRDDLALMYVVHIAPSTGKLVGLEITPFQIRRFRLYDASQADAEWLRDMLNREGRKLGTRVVLKPDRMLTLRWGRKGENRSVGD
jgi:poly-gamma-glutamate capsule biosynthesis protein CapA/YwtB (metallophosphatase superfamily)